MDTDIKPAVKKAVNSVFRQDMRKFGLKSVNVRPGVDHDGDAVLLIDAWYKAVDVPIDTRVTTGLVTKLRDRLWQLGEQRFPHIRHYFPEDQKVVTVRG